MECRVVSWNGICILLCFCMAWDIFIYMEFVDGTTWGMAYWFSLSCLFLFLFYFFFGVYVLWLWEILRLGVRGRKDRCWGIESM